ncbi:MAG: response regulator transcription factor [Cyclobacteriaceae bacterium]
MSKIKIIVVDDHALVRQGIISMLASVDAIEITGEAENGVLAMELLESGLPDILLVDINMPKMDGVTLSEKAIELYPDLKVIILSMDVTMGYVKKSIQAGVKGYIPKDSSRDTLIEAITKVHNGEKFFSERVSEVILKGFYENDLSDKPKKTGDLSKREEEVLKLIASGMSNRDIADKLFISIRTVDAHRNHIIQKLKLRSTAELVKYAIKNQIIELD